MTSESHRDTRSHGAPVPGVPDELRNRLVGSFALTCALAFVWGPYCGLVHVRRSKHAPTELFATWHYLVETTGVTLGAALAFALATCVALAITLLVWRLAKERAGEWFLVGAILILVVAILSSAGLRLPVIRALGWRAEPLYYAGIIWALASRHIKHPAAQMVIFPAIALYPLLWLMDLAQPTLLYAVAALLALGLVRYANADSVRQWLLDSIGMILFITIPLVVFMHISVGRFIPALDIPYMVIFAGMLVLVIAGLLGARSLTAGRMRVPAAACLLGGVIALAGGSLWARNPVAPPQAIISAGERPNIVLVVWDAARAQQLSLYGYPHKTSPELEKIASEGLVFENVEAVSSWTLPTHGSMFTGLWPRTHAASYGGYLKLGADRTTIAELLSEQGYETIGISCNCFWATERAGMDQGFQTWLEPRASADGNARPIENFRDLFLPWDEGLLATEAALRRWLFLREDPDRPFFLFLNYLEPHGPYCAPKDMTTLSAGVSYAEGRRVGKTDRKRLYVENIGSEDEAARKWTTITEMYDGEIRYVDRGTRDIIELLAAAGNKADSTLTIVTADHGEALGEHDRFWHLFSLYETTQHIPLVLKWPGHVPAGARIDRRVSQIDLFATVAEAAGLPPDTWSGKPSRSLARFWGDTQTASPSSEVPIVCEVWPLVAPDLNLIASHYSFATPVGRFIAPLFAVYDGDWKYIASPGQNRELLFDLASDPREETDLSSIQTERCTQMRAALHKWLNETPNNMPTFADGYEKGPLRE